MTGAKRQIGRVGIDVVDRAQALAMIGASACSETALMVAFCNAHTVNMADANPAFAASLADALILNDGIGVELGSRILYGERFPDNLNGTDLTPAVLDHASCPLRIFLLGSPEGVAEQAAAVLRRATPATRSSARSTASSPRVRRTHWSRGSGHRAPTCYWSAWAIPGRRCSPRAIGAGSRA
ncbi:MAG: WecB/TagA/CpsF family glycosyltransferase [Sphingomonas sp.]|nr:WecB/TagA/CpsF family glycosyltransferase [Sphingomonas sp.]